MSRKYANVRIGESKVHGTGVFALRDLRRAESVLEIDDSDAVADRSRLTREQIIHLDVFIDRSGNERVISMKSPEKYINSSCDPNVRSRTDMRSGIRRAYALRDIRKGEEIMWDYELNSWEKWDAPTRCCCGSANCRKTIRGPYFALPREVQLKYLPLLDEPFRRKFARRIRAIQRRSK